MIYFCIPAYNEEKTIGVLLWKLRQVMASFPRDYQLLVVDDASTDKTSEALRPYQRVLPLTVIRNDQRRGYATSVEMLIREAARRSEYPKRDAIITLQADFTEDPDQVITLLKRIEAGDDIVGTKPVVPEDAPWQMRWSRKLALKAIARRGWPEDVDPLSGLRAYRVQVVRKAIETAAGNRLITWSGWLANAELLAAVQPHSRRTEAVESSYRPERHRRPSRLNPWQVVWQAFRFGRGGRSPDSLGPIELPAPQAPERRGKEELQAFVESRGGAPRERTPRPGNGRGRERPERGRDQRRDGRPERPRRDGEPRPAPAGEGRRPAPGEGRRPAAVGEARSGERRQGRPERQEPRGERPERRERPESREQRPERRREGRPEPGRGRQRNGAQRPEVAAAPTELLRPPEEGTLVPAAEAEVAELVADLFAAPEGGEAPKKRRRRRGRGRGRRVTAAGENETPAAEGDTSFEQLELVAAGDAGAEAEAAEGEGETTSEPGARSGRRRRRGGRRGRGRARAAMDGTQENGGESAAEPAPGSSGPVEGAHNEVHE